MGGLAPLGRSRVSPALAWISAVLMAIGLALPIGYYEEDLAYWSQFPLAAVFVSGLE